MESVNLAPLLMPRIAALDAPSLPGRAGSVPWPLPAASASASASPTGILAPSPASVPTAETPITAMSSMRPDQMFMTRQLMWPQLTRTSLAATWRSMVDIRLAALAYASGQSGQTSLPTAGQLPSTQLAVQQALEVPPDAWRFVISRADQQITLRIVESDGDRHSRRRRRRRAALRVELLLADGNRIIIQLEVLDEGVAMQVAAAAPTVLEQIRAALPQLSAAITRTGLRLATVDLGQALPAGRPLPSAGGFPSASLPAELFNAMAELVLSLTAPA